MTLLNTPIPKALQISLDEFRNYQKKRATIPWKSAFSQEKYNLYCIETLKKLGISSSSDSYTPSHVKKVPSQKNDAIDI